MSDRNINNGFYSMYMENNWNKLNEDQKITLLEDTISKEQENMGLNFECDVKFVNINDNSYGYQNGNTIYLNRGIFINGKSNEKDLNYQALETVLHEHRHVFQENVISGDIKVDNLTTALFKANDFKVVEPLNDEKGCLYLQGVSDDRLYYLNTLEVDAFRTSEKRTLEIINNLEKEHGNENAMAVYKDDLKTYGIEARINELKEVSNNENIEKETAKVLANWRYNLSVVPDPKIVSLIQNEMIATYKQDKIFFSKEDEISIPNDNAKTSKEEYEKIIMDSFNNHYTHIANDKSLTNTEKMEQTQQLSENAYISMVEFEQSYNEKNALTRYFESDNNLSSSENEETTIAISSLNYSSIGNENEYNMSENEESFGVITSDNFVNNDTSASDDCISDNMGASDDCISDNMGSSENSIGDSLSSISDGESSSSSSSNGASNGISDD